MYVEIGNPEIRQAYVEDLCEKSKAAHGVFGRASRKKGFKGKVRFPSDAVIADRRKWKKLNSKVKVYYMYEVNVIKIEDLADKTLQEEIDLLNQYKADQNIGIKRLATEWNVEEKWISNIFYRYNKMVELGKDPTQLQSMLPREIRYKVDAIKKAAEKAAENAGEVQSSKEEPQKRGRGKAQERQGKEEKPEKSPMFQTSENEAGKVMIQKLDGISTVLKGIGQMMDPNKKYVVSVVIREA